MIYELDYIFLKYNQQRKKLFVPPRAHDNGHRYRSHSLINRLCMCQVQKQLSQHQ